MAQKQSTHGSDFPWDIGVFDAHCHPTDTMSSIADIPRMKATTLTIMATRGEDQDLVLQTAVSLAKGSTANESSTTLGQVLPCFGWHPWFSHQILNDFGAASEIDEGITPIDRKRSHYTRVLKPTPDDKFISSLPDPKPLSQLLTETRTRLTAMPFALVGEVGLDRPFRLPAAWSPQEIESRDGELTPGSREGRLLSPHQVRLEHQKTILEAQLRLAGELRRPVSVHSVQAHGAVFDLFKLLWSGHERKTLSRRERKRRLSVSNAHTGSDEEEEKKHLPVADKTPLPFPPRICMHSYSGPVDPLKQFLNPSNPSDVYFSFSSVINFGHSASHRTVEVIKALPDDRVLIESDLHIAGQQMDDYLEEIARQICEIRGWDLRNGVQQLAENWRRFVFG